MPNMAAEKCGLSPSVWSRLVQKSIPQNMWRRKAGSCLSSKSPAAWCFATAFLNAACHLTAQDENQIAPFEEEPLESEGEEALKCRAGLAASASSQPYLGPLVTAAPGWSNSLERRDNFLHSNIQEDCTFKAYLPLAHSFSAHQADTFELAKAYEIWQIAARTSTSSS